MVYSTFLTSPKEYWITIAPKTADEALDVNSSSVAVLKKEAGETVCKAFLTYIVTDLISSFNVGKTMDINQVVFVVNAIEQDYYYLRPEELKYCFTQAKKGRYGTTYDRIDAQVIYSWIEKYLEERQQVCYDRNIQQNKQQNSTQITSEKVANILRDVVEKCSHKEEDKKIQITPPREKTPAEIFIQEMFKEFDKVWLEQSKKDDMKYKEPIKTVFYKGEHLSQEKFIETKILEHAETTKIKS